MRSHFGFLRKGLAHTAEN